MVTNRSLENSEETYRLLFECSPLPKWIYNPATLAILDANEAALKIYGYKREELSQLRVTDLRTPEDVPTMLKELAELPPNGFREGEWRHQKRDGSLIWVEVHSQPIPWKGINARICQVIDIT